MTPATHGPVISVMLAVPDAASAAHWYAQALGATELWNVTTQTQTGAALTVQGSAGVSALAFSPAADVLRSRSGPASVSS